MTLQPYAAVWTLCSSAVPWIRPLSSISIFTIFNFHDLIVEASKNSVFKIYNMPLISLQRSLRKRTLEQKGLKTANRYHKELLDSIESGNADLAEKTMHTHIEHALGSLR